MRNRNSRFVKKFGIFSQYILPGSVVLAIVISLIFTWLIWTNPAHFSKNKNENLTGSTTQLSARQLTDIYTPTQLIYTDSKNNQSLLFEQKINVTNEVIKNIKKWNFTTFHQEKKVSAKTYTEILNQPDTLVLNYPDKVAGQIFNDTFNKELPITGNTQFNRIVIPLMNDQGKMYLLDDDNFSVYEVSFKHFRLKNLLDIINKVSKKIPVNELLYHQNVLLMYPNEITLKQYSYLLNKQSQRLFLNSLFNNSANNFKTKKASETTTYEEGNNRRVVFNNETGVANYQSFNGTKEVTGFNNLLRQGFNDLTTIGVPLDNTKYFETSNEKNVFIYRTYVEGFPIFNQTRYGTIRLSYDNPSIEQATFSQYSLQVPLPNNQNVVTLPSSSVVIEKLSSVNIGIAKIQNMQIGYQWETSMASDMVVNLKPVWYIEVDNKWQSLTEWLQQK